MTTAQQQKRFLQELIKLFVIKTVAWQGCSSPSLYPSPVDYIIRSSAELKYSKTYRGCPEIPKIMVQRQTAYEMEKRI
ncbi:hypothetical protein PoB_002396000 [Plakobranchus ocellatus]|uniref:Uncharacterized protein n=1 Tax=Plakobranchus ocellatus TaxID=259542 RepID=A0AAV3ZQP4_9GAST|nr:hypothetical protein PoB_002396000 [Plakobranchus ocellatus]